MSLRYARITIAYPLQADEAVIETTDWDWKDLLDAPGDVAVLDAKQLARGTEIYVKRAWGMVKAIVTGDGITITGKPVREEDPRGYRILVADEEGINVRYTYEQARRAGIEV